MRGKPSVGRHPFYVHILAEPFPRVNIATDAFFEPSSNLHYIGPHPHPACSPYTVADQALYRNHSLTFRTAIHTMTASSAAMRIHPHHGTS